jgi:hypothetical protein
MKINWNKNPLRTTVELDEHEKKEFWYKIKIEEMEESLFAAHFSLQEDKYFDLERARKHVDAKFYCVNDNERSELDQRCDSMLECYLNELNGWHVGDCTCVACSCWKCHAESLLGIDTIKGLGKHSAYKIDSAFGKNNENTIDQALENLLNYNPVRDGEWLKLPKSMFDSNLDRWRSEAKSAYNWLKKYKEDHLDDFGS